MKASMPHVAVLVATGCLVTPVPTLAQQQASSSERAGLEEIIVTAQRREESLQSVPIAVSAFSSQAIEQLDIRTIRDVSYVVPNLWMETNTGLSSGSRASLRGIGEDESFFTSDTPVGIYIDDVYIPRQNGAMFDLNEIERIEVLRGPQGTLYGRNTSAGAIKLVSRRPGDSPRAMVELTAGDYDRQDVRLALSGPISDTVAGQVSLLSRQHDGYDKNLFDGSRVNDQDVRAGRIALQYRPTDAVDLFLVYDRLRERSTPGYATGLTLQPPDGLGKWNPNDQVDGDRDVHTLISDLVDPINDIDQEGVSLTATWRLERVTLKSITAWREMTNTLLLDADGQTTCFGLELPCLHLFQDQAQDQISQELQLQGSLFGDAVDYVAGVYYFEESNQQRTENIILAPFGTNPYSDTSLDTDSIAVFASGTWSVNDRLNLTAGLRWTRDTKDYHSAVFESDGSPRQVCADPETREVFSSAPCAPDAPASAVVDDLARSIRKSWSEVTPRLALDYALAADKMIYASASKGFKSGSFDGREVGTALYALQAIDPETVYSYEIGTKAEWFENKVRTNVAVFLNDFQDLQGTGTDQETGSLTRFSVGDVETKGVEFEVTAEPVPDLVLTGNLGLLDTRFTTINFDQEADCGPVGTGNADLQLKFAPKVSAFLAANYRLPLQGVPGAVRLGADWTSKSSFFHSSCNPLPSKEDGYEVVNAQVAYESTNGRWSLIGQVRNLTDEEYAAGQFFIPGLGFDAVYFNAPRTWAISLRYTFE
jgi:iron complex outermembrane receptor protein